MNTRQPIQPSNQPAVLSLAFSTTQHRFIAGLADGIRVFRSDNCLTTYHPPLPRQGGIAIAEALDDRHLAFVGGGKSPTSSANVVIFWDAVLGEEVTRFDLHEPVLGLRLCSRWMAVVLRDRVVLFAYQHLRTSTSHTHQRSKSGSIDSISEDAPQIYVDASSSSSPPKPPQEEQQPRRSPNLVHALYLTSPNPHALAVLQPNLLALSAQSTGQVQLIPLPTGSKRILRAHNSALRCLALSNTGTRLATASEQGTLIRVFDTRTLDQLAELRRGMDHAIIYGLAFSPQHPKASDLMGPSWLACTSDKGTLHIFDLRPAPSTNPNAEEGRRHPSQKQSPHSAHQPPHPRKLPLTANTTIPSLPPSAPPSTSTKSTPHHLPTAAPGSIQEYYHLPPFPPHPNNPSHHHPHSSSNQSNPNLPTSVLSVLKSSPLAPRLLIDTRSIASAPFSTGNDPLHWQGGASHTWTTTPSGARRRVRNAVLPLPGREAGKPPKGVVGWAFPANAGAGGSSGGEGDVGDGELLVYVLGGGSDAIWEVFELGLAEGGGWGLVRRGFRRFLTRQFVD